MGITEDEIQRINEEIQYVWSNARQEYNDQKIKALDFYENNQEMYLEDALRKRFVNSFETKEKIIANITALVVDEMASIYGSEPLRVYSRDNIIEDSATEYFNRQDAYVKRNAVLQNLDAMTHLLGMCALWVQYDTYKQQVVESVVMPQSLYLVWPQDKYHVDYTNPRNVTAVIIEVAVPEEVFTAKEKEDKVFQQKLLMNLQSDKAKRLRRFCYISRKNIIYYDSEDPSIMDKDMIVMDRNNPDFLNPLKEIPLVWSQEKSGTYGIDDKFGMDLISANESVNMLLSATISNAYFQGFGMPVLFKHNPPANMVIGYELPLVCDPNLNEDFKYVAPPAMFPQLFKMAMDHLKMIALTKKIPLNVVSIEDRQGASGLALKVEGAAKLEARTKRLPNFYKIEREAYILKLMWYNLYKPKGFDRRWNDLELQVIFKEPYEPVDENAEAEKSERDLGMGLTNPVEILMRRHNINSEIAQKRYAENLMLIKQLKEVINPVNITGVTDNTTKDAIFEARGQDGKYS